LAIEQLGVMTRSVPEADLLALLARSSVLPRLWANPRLTDRADQRLMTPDVWIDDVGLAVMVHSRRFHEAHLDREATVESDSDLQALGIVVVPVTPVSIVRDPQRVLDPVEGAWIKAAASRPRPDVLMTPQVGLPLAGS
jgi:hypothetical protein